MHIFISYSYNKFFLQFTWAYPFFTRLFKEVFLPEKPFPSFSVI